MNRYRQTFSRIFCAAVVLGVLFAPAAAHAQQGTGVCAVATGSLNLRAGPGADYDALAQLNRDTQLRAVGRNAAGSWLYVQVVDTGDYGWVNAARRYVTCNVEISSLPQQQSSEQPSGTAYVVRPVPTPDADPGDMIGWVYASGDYYYQQAETYEDGEVYYGDEELTFYGLFSIGLYVFDPRFGTTEGAGVDRVEFSIANDDTGDEIYTVETEDGDLIYRREGGRPYCLFSNQENSSVCSAVRLGVGANWPNTDQPIEPGSYRIRIRAYSDNWYREVGRWDFDVILE